ncbi:N-acetyltransferase [Arundinibacter roseus]|uniref:N-acetyltransferase n=2 Tax=Arundinibacter roseus TaxID=2070510 RepID=A0A4R4KCF1_9BACT|nr:N-acetyltransferase [Arundinibacter roseus]
MKIFAETERLILREILPTDIDGMFELHSDPEVHRFLGNKTVKNKEETNDLINFVRKQYIDFGIGRWAIIEKNTNNFIGWTGLELVTEPINNHKNYYDLGYRLIRKYWGQGIATESAVASLKYAFEKLKTDEVFARADSENIGSDKVLKKVGLKLIETFDLDGIKHNWYKIDGNDYDKTKPNR